MRRLALTCCALVGAVAIVGIGRPATAEPLLSISYDVTGGTFPPTVFEGPITGGTVEINLPGSSTSTPVYCTGAFCGTVDILLSGPGIYTPTAFFPFTDAQLYLLTITASYVRALFTYKYVNPPFSYQTTGLLKYPAPGKSYGTGKITVEPMSPGHQTFTIPFQFGNEVRVLPEPSSNAAVATGVALLGLIGTFRARLWRARRARCPQR